MSGSGESGLIDTARFIKELFIKCKSCFWDFFLTFGIALLNGGESLRNARSGYLQTAYL